MGARDLLKGPELGLARYQVREDERGGIVDLVGDARCDLAEGHQPLGARNLAAHVLKASPFARVTKGSTEIARRHFFANDEVDGARAERLFDPCIRIAADGNHDGERREIGDFSELFEEVGKRTVGELGIDEETVESVASDVVERFGATRNFGDEITSDRILFEHPRDERAFGRISVHEENAELDTS
jgi:hypothetical protein